jgi:hypothetical protein
MENVAEIVALLRKQADLECQILNAQSIAVGAEQELDVTRRRLATHPQALKGAADGSARRHTPDAVSVQNVTALGGSIGCR